MKPEIDGCLFQLCHPIIAELAHEVAVGGRGREAQPLQQLGGVLGYDRVQETGREPQALKCHEKHRFQGAVLLGVFQHVPRSPALQELIRLEREGGREGRRKETLSNGWFHTVESLINYEPPYCEQVSRKHVPKCSLYLIIEVPLYSKTDSEFECYS